MFFIASARVIKKNNIVINNPLVSKYKDMFNTMLNFFCGWVCFLGRLFIFMSMDRLKLMGWGIVEWKPPLGLQSSGLCAT